MGYFDGIANMYFKKDAEGKTVFYPWGVIGEGYKLTDDAAETKIRSFVKQHYAISLPVVVIAVNVNWGWLFVAAGALYGWYYLRVRALLDGSSVSKEKLSLKESYFNSAKAHNKYVLWLLFACSLFFVVAGLYLMFVVRGNSNQFALLLSTLFFSVCASGIGYMIKRKAAHD